MERINCVLLIDDDNSANFISKNIINKLGCAEQVLEAHNGREALQLLEEKCMGPITDNCPELILLDLKMPVMDGFEFMQVFEEMELSGRRPVVVMLTTSTNPTDVRLAQQYHIAEFVNKPLRRETMASLMEKYFNCDSEASLQVAT